MKKAFLIGAVIGWLIPPIFRQGPHWKISEDGQTASIHLGSIEPGQWAGGPPPKCHHILQLVDRDGEKRMMVFGSSAEIMVYQEGLNDGGYKNGRSIRICSRENKHEDHVAPCGPGEEWNSCHE